MSTSAVSAVTASQAVCKTYYTAKSQAPKAEANPNLGRPMGKALASLYQTVSLNHDAIYGIGSPGSRGNQVARAHQAIDNVVAAIQRVLKAPVSNNAQTAALRSALSDLRERFDYIADAGQRTRAVHLTGSGLTRLDSMLSVMQRVFAAADMPPVTQFRDTTNLRPSEL